MATVSKLFSVDSLDLTRGHIAPTEGVLLARPQICGRAKLADSMAEAMGLGSVVNGVGLPLVHCRGCPVLYEYVLLPVLLIFF